VQRSHQSKRTAVERWRSFRLDDKGSRAASWLQHADRRKRADTRTQSRATHAELLREIALWRQSIARPQLASMNHFTKLRDDFFE
jgi:hypothetical protein